MGLEWQDVVAVFLRFRWLLLPPSTEEPDVLVQGPSRRDLAESGGSCFELKRVGREAREGEKVWVTYNINILLEIFKWKLCGWETRTKRNSGLKK